MAEKCATQHVIGYAHRHTHRRKKNSHSILHEISVIFSRELTTWDTHTHWANGGINRLWNETGICTHCARKIPKPIKLEQFLRSDLLNQKQQPRNEFDVVSFTRRLESKSFVHCAIINYELLIWKEKRHEKFQLQLIWFKITYACIKTPKRRNILFIQFKTNFFPQKQNFKLKQKTKRMKQIILDFLFYTILHWVDWLLLYFSSHFFQIIFFSLCLFNWFLLKIKTLRVCVCFFCRFFKSFFYILSYMLHLSLSVRFIPFFVVSFCDFFSFELI